jgi:membrane protein DedA with SNARE-associated domain
MFDIDTVILWLQQNPEWVAWGLFLTAFIESFAIIGIFIPGVVLLAVISGMSASADFNLLTVLVITFVASFLADVLSFIIGRRFSKKIDSTWPFTRNPIWLARGRKFFKNFGVFGVLIGKFIGPIRPVMPLTAGSMIIDILSSLLWAPLYTLPGYFAGKVAFENLDNPYLLISVFGTFALVAIIFITFFRNKA